MDNIQRLEQQAKKVLNKILSLFPIPKMHPKLIDMEREVVQIALLGEINTEKIMPLVNLDEMPLKPSKKFDWFFEPYALVEPSELKSGFCPKCYAKVNSENNTKRCGCCGQFLMWEGYDG